MQEHNIRKENILCNEILDAYHFEINNSIALKGGTAIMINKRLPYNIFDVEKSADSRIISVKLKIYDQIFQVINIYAHASDIKERESLFINELPYYVRNSLKYTLLGGDFNCVVLERDTMSENAKISLGLKSFLRSLQLKDLWFAKNSHIEYTFVREDFGARIDRLYAKDLYYNVKSIKTIHVNFSDHSSILTDIEITNIPKTGKYYWKLNTSILEMENIEYAFKDEWERIKTSKNKYRNLNEWWDKYAKLEIKHFCIKISKKEKQRKYGLLNYLELCLNKVYNDLNLTGSINYSEVKLLKDRIDNIKTEMMNGVKIRSRIEEQIEGEKVSPYLIKQQSSTKCTKLFNCIKAEEGIIENVNEGTELKNKDSIELYINKFYEKLYKKENSNAEMQNWLVDHIEEKLDENDQALLMKKVNSKEIYDTLKDMNQNKSPGIDGLPIEFYLKFWKIIKNELCEIVINMINGENLQENQRKAILVLIYKDGEINQLKNWRPISLICSDVKIVAKVLARRLKQLMDKIISRNQYCVQNRTISDCTCKIRDTLYYLNEKNMTGALINLDWEKAFNKVNWEILIKTMKKIGFPEAIIKWIMNLYENIQSVCLVNGFITKPFSVERGIRQGCPLSMIVHFIFQESLYKVIEKSQQILPIEIGMNQEKLYGYADDTSAFMKNDQSILEFFKIIKIFELATNSRINISKTKIFGFGEWKNRTFWPIKNIKTEMEHFKTLGIIFSTNYDTAIELTWETIYEKICKRIKIIKTRNYTLYQRAVIVNALLASKIWYTAHIYPYPTEISNKINTEIYTFIWGGENRKPLQRDILCNPKEEGGIGLINIFTKARSIFISTVLKKLLNPQKMR